MKNLEISKNFGIDLESIVDKNSYSGYVGNVGSSANQLSRPVFAPYTGVQIGTLDKNYSGQEFLKGNYEIGLGTPVNRKY